MDLTLQGALQLALDRILEWLEAGIAAIPNLVVAVIILFAFWLLARTLRGVFQRVFARVSTYTAVNRLLSSLIFGAVFGLGFLIALGILNLDTTVTSLLAGAGILGLAVGFAAQDSAENLIAGVLLSVRRPFKEGELISSNDIFGVVKEINLRSTVIRTTTGQVVYIPNKQVLGNPLENYTESGERRVDLACGISYADDLEAVRKIAVEAIERVEHRDAGRDVEFYYQEFGGSSIDFVLRFWIPFTKSNAEYLGARSEAIVLLKQAFDDEGITIPFPIRTLDFGISGGVSLAEQIGSSRLGS